MALGAHQRCGALAGFDPLGLGANPESLKWFKEVRRGAGTAARQSCTACRNVPARSAGLQLTTAMGPEHSMRSRWSALF